jgi:hypothetical protein
MVGDVGDEEPSLFGVERQAVRLDEACARRRSVVPGEAR